MSSVFDDRVTPDDQDWLEAPTHPPPAAVFQLFPE